MHSYQLFYNYRTPTNYMIHMEWFAEGPFHTYNLSANNLIQAKCNRLLLIDILHITRMRSISHTWVRMKSVGQWEQVTGQPRTSWQMTKTTTLQGDYGEPCAKLDSTGYIYKQPCDSNLTVICEKSIDGV